MQNRTMVSLDKNNIELRTHQTLMIPGLHPPPFDEYVVKLKYNWSEADIDVVIPTTHLISADGFSQVSVIRPYHRDPSEKNVKVRIDTSHGSTLYNFLSHYRRPIAALRQRFEALLQRARDMRQLRIDTTLATLPAAPAISETPIRPAIPLRVDPELRIDFTRLNHHTLSGTIDIMFVRPAESAQIVRMFGPISAWHREPRASVRIEVEPTLAGLARYFVSWRTGVTITLVVEIGSRAASNFHQYMMQVAGHDETASDAVLLPIATDELTNSEQRRAISQLRQHALSTHEASVIDPIPDEVWRHVLSRRQVPRTLVYPPSNERLTEFKRLCDEVVATQHIHQFCHHWFRRHALPAPELASINAVIDNAGQDATAYLQTVPPLLRQLSVAFSDLHEIQVIQACQGLRNAWLTSQIGDSLAPALERYRLLRSSTLRQALSEHGSVVIDWLLPGPEGVSTTAVRRDVWNAVVTPAMRATLPRDDRLKHYDEFMQLRRTLASDYPDLDQLRQSALKKLLRKKKIKLGMHELALVEFEPHDTDQRLAPARVHFIDALLRDGMPADITAAARVYHFHTEFDSLAWKATTLTLPDLRLMLAQANTNPRQHHHNEMTRYWGRHGAPQSGGDDLHTLILSAQACLAAHDLCNAGHLPAASLQCIITAAGFGTQSASDIECHLLDLGGIISTDLVTIRGSDAGVVLYRPGHWPQFQHYADMGAMREAIAVDCNSETARRQWATHFAPETRPDSFKAGIDTLLLRLGNGELIGQIALAESLIRVDGDVFHQVARRQQQVAENASAVSEALCSSPWSNAERFFEDDLDLSAHAVSGAWMDALVAALALRRHGKPAWNRASHLIATPPTGVRALPTDLQQELLQEACRQEREQALWHHRAPNIAIDGAQYMQDFLRKTFPDHFVGSRSDGAPDVHQLVLNEYYPPESNVAFYMVNDISLLRRRKSSIPLSQLSYCNIDVAGIWDALITTGDRYFTISHKNSVPNHYDDNFDNIVDPKVLVGAIIDGRDFDFATYHRQQIERYFTDHGATLARLARERALLTAQLMLHEGELSHDNYQLIEAAFGPAGGMRTDAAVYPLRVSGHAARDCLHLHCKVSGRRVLYLAGDDVPYLAFEHLSAAKQFLLDLKRDDRRLLDFAHTHFAREDAEERRAAKGLRLTISPGVINVLRTNDQAAALNANPQLAKTTPRTHSEAVARRHSAERLRDLLDEKEPIRGDPFTALVAIGRRGAAADATYFIRSASDRMKEQWMEYARIIPVDFVEGLVKLALGKTAADLRSARRMLGTDLALNLLPLLVKVHRTANPVISIAGSRTAHALVRGVSRNEPVARLARWFKPPQRLNGQIGYPLSPPRPPVWRRIEHNLASRLLDMRVFNATIRDAQGILHTDSPMHSPKWYTVAGMAVRLDRAATDFFSEFIPPPRLYLQRLDNTDQLFYLAYRDAPEHGYAGLGRGLVVGENHSNTAARRFLNENLGLLAGCGVRTLYTEVFKRDADAELLRIFNRGGNFPDHLLERLRRFDALATPRLISAFSDEEPATSLLMLFDNARRHGLEVRAIDNVPATAPDHMLRRFISPDPRTSSMNYVASRIIRHDQAHFRRHPWVAHMGAGHAVRDYGFPGVNEITGTPSVFVYAENFPPTMVLGDYHLAIDATNAAPQFQEP
jgi:hypothetical protein